ncbi:unnamed protein product, partial [Iphiclides podalirius]
MYDLNDEIDIGRSRREWEPPEINIYTKNASLTAGEPKFLKPDKYRLPSPADTYLATPMGRRGRRPVRAGEVGIRRSLNSNTCSHASLARATFSSLNVTDDVIATSSPLRTDQRAY